MAKFHFQTVITCSSFQKGILSNFISEVASDIAFRLKHQAAINNQQGQFHGLIVIFYKAHKTFLKLSKINSIEEGFNSKQTF